jgi:hypothetical protein
MGLDISAYSNARLITDHEPLEDEWCEDENHVNAYITDGAFHRSFRGLLNGHCYDVSESEGHGFRAGSYGGYNYWREDLARFALGVDPGEVWTAPLGYQDAPFFELINFSDCEGAIGPEAAVDLLKDFYDHRDKYRASHSVLDRTYDLERYDDWTKACELAAAGGLIIFH